MKRLFFLLIALVALMASAQEYRLKQVVRVPGRQGVAADSNYYYISDTRGLYKYDRQWNLVQSRVQTETDGLFPHPDLANHFGDIDVWNGRIYTGNEHFNYGRGHNISVSVYDARTLQWIEDIPWKAESGQVEVSGVAVDPATGLVWLSDWVDSRWVYAYDLEQKTYVTKMQCRPTPYWCQGIAVNNGKMYFSADDGEAEYHIADCIYVADLQQSVQPQTEMRPSGGKLTLLREMTDFRRAGEIEGLCFDPITGDLLVLNNRGTKIVLGMSQGALTNEGYTEEIHEVYIYEQVK